MKKLRKSHHNNLSSQGHRSLQSLSTFFRKPNPNLTSRTQKNLTSRAKPQSKSNSSPKFLNEYYEVTQQPEQKKPKAFQRLSFHSQQQPLSIQQLRRKKQKKEEKLQKFKKIRQQEQKQQMIQSAREIYYLQNVVPKNQKAKGQSVKNDIKNQMKQNSENNLTFENISEIAGKPRSIISIKPVQRPTKVTKNHLLKENIIDKVQLHLEIIGQLGQYSQEIINEYEEVQTWQQLAFLVYKQFFTERQKVVSGLRKHDKNPFNLSVCTISDEQLKKLRKRVDIIKTIRSVETDNKKIQKSLKQFYKELIYKDQQYKALVDRTYCEEKLFELIREEVNVLKELVEREDSLAKERLKTVYKCYFLILELRGKSILPYDKWLKEEEKGRYLEVANELFDRECE